MSVLWYMSIKEIEDKALMNRLIFLKDYLIIIEEEEE